MLHEDEQFIWDVIDAEGGFKPLDKAVEDLCEYIQGDYYESKNRRLDQLALRLTDIYEWAVAVFTATLTHKQLTYQALCGILHSRIKSKEMSVADKVKTTAEIVAVISKSGLIIIVKQGPGKSILIEPGFNFDIKIPAYDKHTPIFEEPIEFLNNKGMMLGHVLNKHNSELCLDHINRMNAIPLSLNTRILSTYAELSDKPLDTAKKKQQWELMVENSKEKYAEFIAHGNIGYLKYAYDSRGRSYDRGYYITVQGTSYKKAVVELANKELVKESLNETCKLSCLCSG